MADTPVKKRDRQRPFLKLKPRPAEDRPDGRGSDCGCFTPAEFGDLDKGALEVLTSNVELLGDFHKALEKARDVAKTTSTILAGTLAGLATLLGIEVPPFLLVAALVVKTIIETTDEVLDLIERKIIGRFAKRLLPIACRAMPQWVPVKKGASSVRVGDDQIVEVQGLCTASYQNPLGVPFFQWNRWYGWSLHIKPDSGFEKVLSPAPNPPSKLDSKGAEESIQQDGTIECLWDCGVLFGNHAVTAETGVPEGNMVNHSIPFGLADWAWPMAGQFVWATGRWAYDCSRATTDNTSGLMAAVLNPLKAVATVRHAGFKFPENEKAVPATQFLFFTCKRGGYIDHEAINDRDYEFVVDLPEAEVEALETVALGRTEKSGLDFQFNTLVLRPRLLVHVNSGAFSVAGAATLEPIVELLPPERGKTPTHVKVKVPASSLPATAEAAGFVLSLGWFDSSGALAEKVRRTIVTLKRIEGNIGRKNRDALEEVKLLVDEAIEEIKAEARKEVEEALKSALGDTLGGVLAAPVSKLVNLFVDEIVGSFLKAFIEAVGDLFSTREEWLVHLGVNGRWLPVQFEFKGEQVPLNQRFEFFLPVDEPVRVAMSGVDFDPVGEIMRDPRSKRLLDPDGNPVTWPQIVDASDADRRKMVLRYVFKLLPTLGDDNDPTSVVHEKQFGLGTQLHDGFFIQAFPTRALKDQRTVVSDAAAPLADHSLHYSIEFKTQE